MYPFYNVQPAIFPFFPFFPKRRMKALSGIPVLKTTGIVATATEVRYDVNHQEFMRLPKEGLFILDVKQQSATADAALPVTLSDQDSSESNNSMLRNGLAEPVQAGDLVMSNRYLIYYNKCTNSYQLINSYPNTVTAPAA